MANFITIILPVRLVAAAADVYARHHPREPHSSVDPERDQTTREYGHS